MNSYLGVAPLVKCLDKRAEQKYKKANLVMNDESIGSGTSTHFMG